jgi:phage baseplate assembly protein W
MPQIQYYGLKYPFRSDRYQNYLLDLNSSLKEKVRSQLMNVIFTQKGTRIRRPEFGTDLIKYIFELNDASAWSGIRSEISSSVERYIPNISLKDIQIVKSEDNDHQIFVRIDYSIIQGNLYTDDSFIVEL